MTDIDIKIKPNGDIIVKAYDDTYEFDIYKAPEVIQKLNPQMFTYAQLDAIRHIRHLLPNIAETIYIR